MPNWGQGAQGAAGGAMAGAALGPWGAAIGGGIGGALGLFGGGGGPKYDQALKGRLMELERQYGARAAPTGVAQSAANSDFRQNQAALISQQESMARGEGPSAATIHMREAMDRTTASGNSMAAGAVGRGVNAGAALRGASNNAAAIQSQGARDTGLMRVNEQLGAMNQLGLTLHGARGADESTNKFNAAQGNEMTQANMNAQLQQYGINDRAQLQALSQAMGTMYGQAPGLGSQIMAGGASAFPGMMQAFGKGQQPQGTPVAPAKPQTPQAWSDPNPVLW